MNKINDLSNDLDRLQELLKSEQTKNMALTSKCQLLEEMVKDLRILVVRREEVIVKQKDDMKKILDAQRVILQQVS